MTSAGINPSKESRALEGLAARSPRIPPAGELQSTRTADAVASVRYPAIDRPR